MPQTPNHDYNVPRKGAKDWHKPLNQNFRQYDTDIEIRDAAGNRGNYTPKQGAKYLATDTGTVFLGNGSKWQPVATTGPDPTVDELEAARIGIGRSPIDVHGLTVRLNSGDGSAVDARTSSADNTATGVYAEASSTSGNTFGVYAADRSPEGHGLFGVNFADSGGAIGVEGRSQSPDGVGVQGLNRKGLALRAVGDCKVTGDLDVEGAKNFVQSVETDAGEREVVYTAAEAPTPRTETAGVAELAEGRAEVELPDHFDWVTDGTEPLVVQVTPHATEPVRPQVTERSTDRIVVEDLDGGSGYEVSYTVRGTRDGHADKEVVREPSAGGGDRPEGAPADD